MQTRPKNPGSLLPLWLALGAIAAVSVLLIAASYATIEYLRRDLESNIAVLARKTDFLTQMRDHARSRAISVHRMALLEDRFAREDEYLRLLNFGDLFLRARDQFLSLPLTTREQTLWEGLLPLLTRGKETHERAIDAMQAGDFKRAQQTVLYEIIPAHDVSMAAINMLIDVERDSARELVDTARASFDRSMSLILGLGGLLLGSCVVAAFVLTRRAHESRRTLISAIDAAKRADALKCEFLARVSHELRTPLTAILGYAELLIDDHANDRGVLRDVERIRLSGQHLLRLIDDVLDLSRIETGRYHMTRVAIDLSNFIADLVADYKTGTRTDNRIRVDCTPGVSLTTDPRALRQILTNLLSNADKFTNRGDIYVIASQSPEGMVEIHVKDTGIGMTDAQMARVFEPFVQGSPEIAAKYGGAGLGLSVVRQLCTVINARVSVTSTPGHGSQFTLILHSRENLPHIKEAA